MCYKNDKKRKKYLNKEQNEKNKLAKIRNEAIHFEKKIKYVPLD